MTGPIIRPGSTAVNIVTGASEQDFIGIVSVDADGTLVAGGTTVEVATDSETTTTAVGAAAGLAIVFGGF